MYDFFKHVVVRPKTRCWIWTGARRERPAGSPSPTYGVAVINQRKVSVHRLSYEQHVGPIPTGMVVRHTCDHGLCVNPDHLRPGTQLDNVKDCIDRGRRASHIGELNPPAKLALAQVLAIRASTEKGPLLAARYGVSNSLIWAIRRRKLWKHVA